MSCTTLIMAALRNNVHPLSGVYAAAVTPLDIKWNLLTTDVPTLLGFLSKRGCHGALLMGTTGEGPSLSSKERIEFWQAAADWRAKQARGFRLLAGTGTPSLPETIELTKAAFELGFEAVCVLPPFFFRNASEDGLFEWFSQVIDQAVPKRRWLLGYHIPAVSGVALPLSLLQRLNASFPNCFGGLKDSSGSLDSAREYAQGLPGKAVLVGNDKLLGPGLAAAAAGCITAGANLWSPYLREIFDAHNRGEEAKGVQSVVDSMRAKMDAMPPAPAYVKAILHKQYDLPLWKVRSPLRDFSEEQTLAAVKEIGLLHEKM